jgi:hypothetical protein
MVVTSWLCHVRSLWYTGVAGCRRCQPQSNPGLREDAVQGRSRRRCLRTSGTCRSGGGATSGRGTCCRPTAWATGACAATAPPAPSPWSSRTSRRPCPRRAPRARGPAVVLSKGVSLLLLHLVLFTPVIVTIFIFILNTHVINYKFTMMLISIVVV